MENGRGLSDVASAKSERWIVFISSDVSALITDAKMLQSANHV